MTAAQPVIRFNEADHTYTLDGKLVPSVTKVIEIGYDFRFVDADAMERARDLGTKVHKTVQLHEAGTLKRDTLHETLAKYLKQWEAFKADIGFLPRRHEVVVGSRKYSFCGTFDCEGLLLPMNEGDVEEDLLLDIKTGQRYAPHKLQTAGYLTAAVEMGELPASTKRASLYLSEDGYDLQFHSSNMDKPAFLSLATYHHWSQHHGK